MSVCSLVSGQSLQEGEGEHTLQEVCESREQLELWKHMWERKRTGARTVAVKGANGGHRALTRTCHGQVSGFY